MSETQFKWRPMASALGDMIQAEGKLIEAAFSIPDEVTNRTLASAKYHLNKALEYTRLAQEREDTPL